jgi:hypothetical protein
MSLIFEMAIEKAAKELMHNYLYNDSEGTSGGGCNDSAVLNVVAKRRDSKMSWMDFSDKELRIVNEVEKNPGMGGKQIIAFMSTFDSEYPDGQCQEAMTKMLLANLVDRKVLISQGKQGYILNVSVTPPPPPSYQRYN